MTDLARVVTVARPDNDPSPVVLDSPHSGRVFPDDFGAAVGQDVLRIGEDVLIDQLFPGPANGATMVAAQFPRTYIDPNRALVDLDPAMLDGPWPDPLEPGPKTALGKGLVWSTGIAGVQLYDRKLSVAEVRARIDHYWRPYREAVQSEQDRALAAHGRLFHVNCHSMPSLWPLGVEGGGQPVEADFIVGDRDGTTCGRAFRDLVVDVLGSGGRRVAVNDRFKGVDIVRTSGDPANGRHSLQIEVVRDRYMDETTFEPNEGFAAVQSLLGDLVAAVVDHARSAGA